jgi:hypothetical protein
MRESGRGATHLAAHFETGRRLALHYGFVFDGASAGRETDPAAYEAPPSRAPSTRSEVDCAVERFWSRAVGLRVVAGVALDSAQKFSSERRDIERGIHCRCVPSRCGPRSPNRGGRHRHFALPQSSSASRFTAGAAGFLLLIQSRERPER